jgi:hypothetical protein
VSPGCANPHDIRMQHSIESAHGARISIVDETVQPAELLDCIPDGALNWDRPESSRCTRAATQHGPIQPTTLANRTMLEARTSDQYFLAPERFGFCIAGSTTAAKTVDSSHLLVAG